VLRNFSIPDNVIEQQVNLVRAGRYDMLRGRARPQQSQAEWMRVLESAVTQTYYVESESPPCGKTIAELDLRKRTGATIVAATRAGKPYPSPSPDFEVSAGDVLVLVGTHHQLDEARHALSGH
jgi:K+/H+ antiporter YhaU regulatory subunit KhtT